MENLEHVDHMLMISCHSHMEVDSMRAHMENQSDTLNIYVPNEWPVVASVGHKNPYFVDIFETNDVKEP